MTNGAKVFIKNIQTGKYLFVLRDDKPTIPNPNRWGLLGGGVEEGETPKDALKRELQEETNIHIFHIQQIGQRSVTLTVQGKQSVVTGTYFIAETDTPLKEMTLREGQELNYFSLEQICQMENVVQSIPKLTKEYATYIQ